MAGQQRRSRPPTRRDRRRRALGQNFLVDRASLARIVDAVGITPGELVVEPGPGRGALTIPLARAGADVIAIEADPVWARQLRRRIGDAHLTDRVTVVNGDAIAYQPDRRRPYRVVGNPAFASTTALLASLLDNPASGPTRIDLLLQLDVARKRSAEPPTTLRSAAWAPWWRFELGPTVPRTAFRPVPSVDAALLTAHRRDPPILPTDLAADFRQLLRPAWDSTTAHPRRRGAPGSARGGRR